MVNLKKKPGLHILFVGLVDHALRRMSATEERYSKFVAKTSTRHRSAISTPGDEWHLGQKSLPTLPTKRTSI